MLAHLHAPVCRSPGPSVQFLAGDLSPRFLELWLQPPSVASIPSSGLRPTSKQPCPKGLLAPPASQAPRMQREGLATRSQGGENGWAVWPWPQKAGLGLSHVIFCARGANCQPLQLPSTAVHHPEQLQEPGLVAVNPPRKSHVADKSGIHRLP